jgi:hypothetical protein
MSTFSTDGPKCPYCGWQDRPDDSFYYNESGFVMQCEELDCGKKFKVQPYCSWSWTTRKAEAA